MNRNYFLKSALGLSLFSLWGCGADDKSLASISRLEGVNEEPSDAALTSLRAELKAAWDRSEEMTLTNVEQMPPDSFTFKYTEEAMTFSEQWRHCVIFTCGQLSAETGLENPYSGVKLPYQMPKDRIIEELENMYNYVRESIDLLSYEKLMANCSFAGDSIPIWRLFYALENHIIHHRGQCVVYLRLNGVKPKGFYGW